MDFKSSVIEFMRERPFIWNSQHPGFRDYKRRQEEYQAFSNEIGRSVDEIKRAWHVLRTGFVPIRRRMLKGNGSSANNRRVGLDLEGKPLWKYYPAMLNALEGSNLDISSVSTNTNHNNDMSTTSKAPTKSTADNSNTNNIGKRNIIGDNCSSRGFADSSYLVVQNVDNFTFPFKDIGLAMSSKLFKADVSPDLDEDHLHARSLTSTLKRFDTTTKEVIKLKIQEIIVRQMQQGSGSKCAWKDDVLIVE